MTRPELFVLIALSVGWLAVAAWALRISLKVQRLTEHAGAGSAGSSGEAG